MLGNKSGVVKLQAPEVLAVVVPSLVPVVLHTVTVEPSTAVPFNVTESLELTAMLVRLGAAGRASDRAASSASLTTVLAAGTVTPSAFDFALVPAAVVSVAM